MDMFNKLFYFILRIMIIIFILTMLGLQRIRDNLTYKVFLAILVWYIFGNPQFIGILRSILL